MKIILFMAQTINGIIARRNYKEDFLSDENWKTFTELAEKVGCFIVGRKTYQEVQKWQEYNFSSIKAKKIIVSKSAHRNINRECIYVKSPEDALIIASKLNFKTILLAGGSEINSSFLKKKLITEIIINIEPYILGTGISLFAQDNIESKLKAKKIKKLKKGIIQLQYKLEY